MSRQAQKLTKHAIARLSQRGFLDCDPELIMHLGSEVEDGFLFLDKDFQEIDSKLRQYSAHLRRLVGKRIVMVNGRMITGYHAERQKCSALLRNRKQRGLT